MNQYGTKRGTHATSASPIAPTVRTPVEHDETGLSVATTLAVWLELAPYRTDRPERPPELFLNPLWNSADRILASREAHACDDENIDLVDMLLWARRTGLVRLLESSLVLGVRAKADLDALLKALRREGIAQWAPGRHPRPGCHPRPGRGRRDSLVSPTPMPAPAADIRPPTPRLTVREMQIPLEAAHTLAAANAAAA